MDAKGYLDMELLRFTTAGSVDDGKSTLIGRLLYDSKTLFSDQLENIEKVSKQRGEDLNLALLMDGLKAEREQGEAEGRFQNPDRFSENPAKKRTAGFRSRT